MELASMSIDKWMDKKLWYRYTMKYYAAIKNNVFVSVLIQWMNLNLFHFSSVTQSCPTLCNPMDCSTPGLPVYHQLLESNQTHVHWVSDAIQPSHPLSFPSPPALSLFQHQGLFKWVSSSHQVAKVLEFQLQHIYIYISSVQFSHSVVSNSLRTHGLQHTRPPCPSPTPGPYSNSCPLSRWCHPTISSSVVPYSSCFQSFPASGSFPMKQIFSSGGQNIRASASASVLRMNIQDWSPLGWTGWISLQSKGLSSVFSNTTVEKHQFFSAQLSL